MQVTTFNPDDWNLKKFKFGRRLGSGQYGTVYLVKEQKTKTILALKILNKNKIVQTDAIHQIRRQIQIHSHLQHPNILSMYGYFHDQKRIVVMMDYAPYGDLYSHMKANEYTEDMVRNFILQMVKAVHYLQSLSIIHRDIKPENILVSENNTLKLSDFGWSIKTTSHQRKTFCGTPDYFCPEIVKYTPFDYKVDNWCLGILAYELMYKKTPFCSEDQKRMLRRILHKEPKFPFLENGYEPSNEFKDFVVRLTKKDPKERMELSEALNHSWFRETKSYQYQKRDQNEMKHEA